MRFSCPSRPGTGVLRGARGRRCTLGGASGIGISPVAVGCPGTSGCGSSASPSSAGGAPFGAGGGAGRGGAGGRGLSGYQRLRLVDFLVLGGDRLFGLRRSSRRMELGAQEYDQAALFVHLVAHQAFVLRIVQQLAELLEPVLARLEVGTLLLNPIEEFVGGGAGIAFETVNLEDVAQ